MSYNKYNLNIASSKMKCVEIIVKTHPNYGSDEYYRLRPNEYSYVRGSFLARFLVLAHFKVLARLKAQILSFLNWSKITPSKSQMFLDAVITQKVAHVIPQ